MVAFGEDVKSESIWSSSDVQNTNKQDKNLISNEYYIKSITIRWEKLEQNKDDRDKESESRSLLVHQS